MLNLQQFRKKPKGFPDLLNYAALIDSGVILQKDGSLLAGFVFQGEDTQSIPSARLNQITIRVNNALNRFGSGWAFWFEAVRMETAAYSAPEDSYFPDRVSALIDAERRANFSSEGRHFETETAIVLQYTPPLTTESKVAKLMYDDDAVAVASFADQHLAAFQKALFDFEDSMTDAVRMRRMTGYVVDSYGNPVDVDERGDPIDKTQRVQLRDELVNFLQSLLTGEEAPINIPAPAMYMDAYLGGMDLWSGHTPKLGKRFIAVVGVDGFPHQSFPALLDSLNRIAIPFRFSTRFVALDQHEALSQIHKYKRKWAQGKRGWFSQVFKTQGGAINEDAVMMEGEALGALTDAQSGLVRFGYYTPVIVLMDENREIALENARIIAREVRRLGFATRVEEDNALEAWLGSLPGHTFPNIRRPLMHSLAVADMLPLFTIWPGRATNPCPFYPENSPPLLQGSTTGATPFRVNLHVGDVGHTFILGPTGAGKSVLLNALALSQRRYKGAKVTIFDKGFSAEAGCRAVGGNHYAPGADGVTLGFAPLQYLDSDADTAWAGEWLEGMYVLSAGQAPTPDQRKEIHKALTTLRQDKQSRSLSDFIMACQDVDVRAALEHYSITGPLGSLLDSKTDDLADSDYSVFEMQDLLSMGDRNAMPVLLYLFRRFEKSLKGQPSMLILDEAWIMLSHEVFRSKIVEWLKTLRKLNCAVVMATQSVADAVRSGLLDVLNESCPTKIFLPNPEALKSAEIYQVLGLNDRQLELLADAQKKRDYYFTSPEGQRLFQLQLGPIALSFVAASDAESLARIRALNSEYGARWSEQWLRERRIPFDHLIQGAPYAQAA